MTNPVSRASVPAGVEVHVVRDNSASDSGGLGGVMVLVVWRQRWTACSGCSATTMREPRS